MGAVLKNLRELCPGQPVLAFNVNSLETVRAVLDAAAATGRPVAVALGEKDFERLEPELLAELLHSSAFRPGVPVALHLDHARTMESVERALRCGFTSVMYDGSSLPLEENAARLSRVCALAHPCGATVEGELGYLNAEDGSAECISPEHYTDPAAAAELVRRAGIDLLAVAVGNAHGVYLSRPQLDYARIEAIAAGAPGVLLALHGGSGIPPEGLQRAVQSGIAKLNVNTDLSLAAEAALRQLLSGEKHVHFGLLAQQARLAMQREAQRYLSLLSGA